MQKYKMALYTSIILLICLCVIAESQDCALAKLDITFVVDSSGSITDNQGPSQDNWGTMRQFIVQIIDGLNIGPDATHVGLVRFSNKANLILQLDSITEKEHLKENVTNLQYNPGQTNTADGIRVMMTQVFGSPCRGDRSDAPNIGIIITDGVSTRDKNSTIPEANRAKNEGVTMMAVGITDRVDVDELKGLATGDLYLTSPDFNSLHSFVKTVQQEACAITPSPATGRKCDTDTTPVATPVTTPVAITEVTGTGASGGTVVSPIGLLVGSIVASLVFLNVQLLASL